MKKVLIIAVCLALVLTLVFTLGALGKKPEEKPGKPKYVYKLTFTENVTGEVEQCGAQGGFISSSSIDRPTLTLKRKTFGHYYGGTYVGGEDGGLYLDLSKHKDEIRMQYFFIAKDGKKVQLNVYGGKLVGEWLSEWFTIVFNDPDAVILPTRGKRDPLWVPEPEENVNIQVVVTSL